MHNKVVKRLAKKKKIEKAQKKGDLLTVTLNKMEPYQLKRLLDVVDFIYCAIQESELRQIQHEGTDINPLWTKFFFSSFFGT